MKMTKLSRVSSLTPMILGALACVAVAAEAPPRFTMYVEQPGVIAVSHQQLAERGLDGSVPSARIGVRNLGVPVPRWVDDGGDGSFDPGDRVVFVAERLAGEVSFLNEYSRYNAYILDPADPSPEAGMGDADSVAAEPREMSDLVARTHFEEDLLMLRFAEQPDTPVERWYWAKLAHFGTEPFRYTFDSPGLRAPSADAGDEKDQLRLRISCRGWSAPRSKAIGDMPHHAIELSLNQQPVGHAEWSGADPFQVEFRVPVDLVRAAGNQLEIRVPQRLMPGSKDCLIDVLMLNWFEVEYPRSATLGAGQSQVFVADDGSRGGASLSSSAGVQELYTSDARRIRFAGGASGERAVSDRSFPLWSVADQAYRSPDEIVMGRESALRDPSRHADYIVIAHASLVDAVMPLVELHRRRGLDVAVVDVQDVYDEFNHGIIHPRALRDFLSFAYHSWAAPAPRFVLLVGDASWDFKNPLADDANYADWTYIEGETSTFVKNSSTPYAVGALPNTRNLLPTWSFATSQGHAASDNWFVCVDGDDSAPEMAIGRFPAATAEEAAGMAAKTIAFISDPEPGPWRRRQLYITNESVGFQRQTDQLVDAAAARGMVPVRIYPQADEPNNEQHSARIIEQFDQGVQLVFFLGHGGRYIWRTGPPDLRKNHDLFTLEHLDQLAPTRRLPVVVSLTCYTAPFDHPTADSIGEKLIRLPGKGAVAVFAASWRNSPSSQMGRLIIDEMARPGTSLGEAIQRAKAEIRSSLLNQTYNLLGDPALPVLMPSQSLAVDLRADDDSLMVSGDGPKGARVLGELVGDDGGTLAESIGEVAGGRFEMQFTSDRVAADAAARAVRVYAWDDHSQWDAAGWQELPQDLAFVGARGDGGEPPPVIAAGAQPSEAASPPAASPAPNPTANTLRWTTASEVENFGFLIYRALSEDGPFERITAEIIPGGGTVDEPQDYVFVDDSIDPGVGYYYYIESISLGGEHERFSPIIYAKPKQPQPAD